MDKEEEKLDEKKEGEIEQKEEIVATTEKEEDNVGTVAGTEKNVGTVAGTEKNVGTFAGTEENVGTVAGTEEENGHNSDATPDDVLQNNGYVTPTESPPDVLASVAYLLPKQVEEIAPKSWRPSMGRPRSDTPPEYDELKALDSLSIADESFMNVGLDSLIHGAHKGKVSMPELCIFTGKDGIERVLHSVDCQTNLTWKEDLQMVPISKEDLISMGVPQGMTITRLKEHRISDAAKYAALGGQTNVPGHARKLSLEKPERKSSLGKKVKSLGEGVQPGYIDDTYGIPMLSLSTSSDSSDDSDEETDDEDGANKLSITSVGPPQILEYRKESDDDPKYEDNPMDESGFRGQCEFCGKELLPTPTDDEVKKLPTSELYCCREFQIYMQTMAELVGEMDEILPLQTMINVSPHPPYGSKQARREAQERAAQRMRAREFSRQSAMGTMSGSMHQGKRNSIGFQFGRQVKTINYQLSSQKCLEDGWTIVPASTQSIEHEEYFEPQAIRGEMAHALKVSKKTGFVKKYYPNGEKHVIMFPDGTGSVFYPSGRSAITISLVGNSLFTHLVYDDTDKKPNMLGVFDPDGHATTYYNNGVQRICLDQTGGMELDIHGNKKRNWSWDSERHVHVPPIQPIIFAVSPHVALRIMSQSNITLIFTHSNRTCRFQVGSHLKLVTKGAKPMRPFDVDQLYQNEVKNRVEYLFSRVSNMLRYPKCTRLNKLPGPAHLLSRKEKLENMRTLYSKQAEQKKVISKQRSVSAN